MENKPLRERILIFGEEVVSFTTQDILVLVENIYSRQHIVQAIKQLLSEKKLIKTGSTKSAQYSLPHKAHFLFPSFKKSYSNVGLDEQDVFEEFKIRLPQIDTLPNKARRVFGYALTEMVNNAIDHSLAKKITISVIFTSSAVTVEIIDNGIGIYKNIMSTFGYKSELEAIQQLVKGKLTTIPKNHSGQGIFFSSKAVNYFEADSHGYRLIVDNDKSDVAFLESEHRIRGTKIHFSIDSKTPIILQDIFFKYQSEGFAGPFDTTQIVVQLYAFGTDFLSRSEAKRILERLTLFNKVILDFNNVEGIGQAFSDQVFRVFQRENPKIDIQAINANDAVKFMIEKTKAEGNKEL